MITGKKNDDMKTSLVDTDKFGKDMKKARLKRGLSQEAAASLYQEEMERRFNPEASVKQETWACYETGTRAPQRNRFYNICAFLGLHPADYFSTPQNQGSMFNTEKLKSSLVAERAKRNLTKADVAKAAEIPKSVYDRMERTGVANIHSFAQICEYFHFDPDAFLLSDIEDEAFTPDTEQKQKDLERALQSFATSANENPKDVDRALQLVYTAHHSIKKISEITGVSEGNIFMAIQIVEKHKS